MKQILLTGFFFIIKISFILAQSTPSFEALKAERQRVQELKRAYVKNQNEIAKNKAEVAQLQKKIIVLNDSLKLSCATYACAISKTNSFLNNKNFQAAFDYINLADSYSDKNPLEIANLRDRFFKLMNLEVKGSKLKNYACSDYNCVIEKIKKALKIKDYQTAFENIESAESFPQKRDEQIRYLRKKLFDEIDKQRIAALTSRREAFVFADSLSKTKNELKETQKETEKALTDLRNASDQAVLLLLNEIDRNILRLEYDSTFEKCRIALNLKSEKYGQRVKERILEIAYWYTETDTLNAAVKSLNLLNINALLSKDNLLSVIRQNCVPQYFAFLEERYYPKMIQVEGGTFTMGDNDYDFAKPSHSVKVNSFKMAETETTVWQYFIFQKATKYREPKTPTWQWEGNNPIVNVNWKDVKAYLVWLSERLKGKFDVPTEAEWEFAARGGNKSKGFRYGGSDDIEEVAWYYQNSKNKTHTVKVRPKANELGLFDMSGNVDEWCRDNYFEDFYTVCALLGTIENPLFEKDELPIRVIRGGSFINISDICRVSQRGTNYDSNWSVSVGFRCIQSD